MAKPVKHRGRWRLRWTDEHGRRRSEVADDYREACFRLAEHQAQVEQVKRGLRSPAPPDKNFNDLADYWIANRVPQKRSPKDHTSIIRCHLRPFFGAMRLRDIGVAEVDHFQVERMHLDKKTVANHLTLFISMMNLAVDLGWLIKAPKVKKPKIRIFDKDFSYLRTDAEMAHFLLAAEAELVHVLYATALYTGMREGELAGLQWDDVDFEKRLITVQHSFEGPTKAEDVRYVPILDPLLPKQREALTKAELQGNSRTSVTCGSAATCIIRQRTCRVGIH
jgi:hypothetical protein